MLGFNAFSECPFGVERVGDPVMPALTVPQTRWVVFAGTSRVLVCEGTSRVVIFEGLKSDEKP